MSRPDLDPNFFEIRYMDLDYRHEINRDETYYFFSNFFHLASVRLYDIKSHLILLPLQGRVILYTFFKNYFHSQNYTSLSPWTALALFYHAIEIQSYIGVKNKVKNFFKSTKVPKSVLFDLLDHNPHNLRVGPGFKSFKKSVIRTQIHNSNMRIRDR